MHDADPDADARAPAADDDDPVERLERSTRRRRRLLTAVGVLAIGAAVAPCAVTSVQCGRELRKAQRESAAYDHAATAAQIAAVDRATARAEAELADHDARWKVGMVGAESLVPDRARGACHVTLPLRPPLSAQRGGSFNNLDDFTTMVAPGEQAFPLAVSRDGALPAEGPRVTLLRRRAAQLREAIRRRSLVASHAATVAAAEALAAPAFWTHDVVYFARVWQPPVALGATGFTPGHAEGTAVLFDYTAGLPRCIGDITADTTSTHVEYSAQQMHERGALQQWLTAEFDAQLERAIAGGTTVAL